MPIDNKTIKKFKVGDGEAFDTIYCHYSKKMFHFALGLVKDEDIETFSTSKQGMILTEELFSYAPASGAFPCGTGFLSRSNEYREVFAISIAGLPGSKCKLRVV